MSILIRGIDMPKKGEYKPLFIYDTGEVTMEIRGEEVQVATAVPVPPHGDLIDRDELMAKDEKDFSTIMEMTDPETVFGTAIADAHTAIQEMLKTAPTIIEAEEGE